MATYTKANNNTALNVTSSWVGGVVPTAADIGLFSSTYAQTGTIPLGGALAFGGIQVTTYTSGANPVTIGTTTANWTIGSSSINMSTAARNLTINSPITVLMSTNQTWNVNTGRTLTLGSVIGETGGTRSLTKSGAGTLTLSARNTFTGGTTVNAGTLNLNAGDSANSGAILGTLTVKSGATAATTATNAIYGVLSGRLFVTVESGGNFDFGGNSSGTQSFECAFTIQGATVTGTKTDGSGINIAGVDSKIVASGTNTWSAGPSRFVINSAGIQVNSGTTTWSGVIADLGGGLDGPLIKSGAGTLTLSALNTFTGGTTVNAGTLRLAYGNDSGSSPCVRGTLTIKSGATVELTAQNAINGGATPLAVTVESGGNFNFGSDSLFQSFWKPFTIQGATVTGTKTGGANINVYQTEAKIVASGTNTWSAGPTAFQFNPLGIEVTSGTTTWSGIIIEGTGSTVIKSGAGTLALTGANTFTAGFALNAGTVNLGVAQVGSTSGPLGASGTITLGGGTLQYSAANQHDYSSRFSTAASQQYRCDTNGEDVTWGSSLASSGGLLVKSGAGTLTLVNFNTYDGGSTLAGGTVSLAVPGSIGSTGTISFTGGTLQFTNLNTTDYSARFSTAAGQAVSIDTNGQSVTFASSLTSSSGTLTKIGAGTLTLTSASNTYSGATTISAGTLEIGGAGRLGSGTYAANIANSGTLAIATSATQTLSGVISGASGVIAKSGSGALTLSNNSNSYGGGTTLSAGTLNIGANGALGTGTLTLNGGTIASSGAQRTISNALMIEDSFAVDVGSLSLFQQTGAVTLAATPTITTFGIASASTLRGFYISGTVSGLGYALIKAGDGSLIFSGTTYLTNIYIAAGWVVFNSTDADAGTPAIEVASGARFVLGDAFVSATATVSFLTGSGTVSPTWGASTGTRTLSVESGTFSGVLATGASGQVLALTKTTAGALSLSGANTYTGGTTVSNGTLKAGNTAALGTGAANVVSGARLQALASIGGKLNIGGNLTNSGGTLRIGGS